MAERTETDVCLEARKLEPGIYGVTWQRASEWHLIAGTGTGEQTRRGMNINHESLTVDLLAGVHRL